MAVTVDKSEVAVISDRIMRDRIRNWQAQTGLPSGMTPKKAISSIVSKAEGRRKAKLMEYAAKKALEQTK